MPDTERTQYAECEPEIMVQLVSIMPTSHAEGRDLGLNVHPGDETDASFTPAQACAVRPGTHRAQHASRGADCSQALANAYPLAIHVDCDPSRMMTFCF